MSKTINTILGRDNRDVAFVEDHGKMFHTDLQCYVDKIEYDPLSRTGILFMTSGCCDWRGCVRLFQAIDPKVKRIRTLQGLSQQAARNIGGPGPYYREDTLYVRCSRKSNPEMKRLGITGEWDSFLPARKAAVALSRGDKHEHALAVWKSILDESGVQYADELEWLDKTT